MWKLCEWALHNAHTLKNIARFPYRGAVCKVFRSEFHMQVGASFDDFSESSYVRDYLFHHQSFGFVPESNQSHVAFESLWKLIEEAAKPSGVTTVLKEWMDEGNVVTREIVNRLIARLCSESQLNKGLKIACWVRKENIYELTDEDYMLCLDLAANTGEPGYSHAAFRRIQNKTEECYSSLLHLYLNSSDVGRAEKTMKELIESKLIVSSRPYNLMMSIYFRIGRPEKALEMLCELEKIGLEPDVFTYSTMLKYKDQLLSYDDLEAKAEATAKNQEKKSAYLTPLVKNCMMKLYGALGQEDDVERIWKSMTKTGVLFGDYIELLDACASLKNVDKLEKLCREIEMKCIGKKMVRRQCIIMIRAYTRMGMMEKAEEMMEKMKELGYTPGYQAFHYLITGYFGKNETEKALKLFKQSAVECESDDRGFHLPLYSTVLTVMKAFEESGDVKSAEELMTRVCVKSYRKDARLINGLLKVYLKAKVPVFGIEQRMSLFKISPDSETISLLQQITALEISIARSFNQN